MPCSLLSASPEVLRGIILFAIARTPLGPPSEWYSLVLSCRTLHGELDTPAMHTLLFATTFNVSPEIESFLPSHAKSEIQRRFSALKLFRRGFMDGPSFRDALWVAYLMLTAEEPRQMNIDQLLWAGLPNLLLLFLRKRLYDGAGTNNGWPLANEINSLVIALAWRLSSESSVKAEIPTIRDEVMQKIQPYVLAAFRYPLSSVPEYCFSLDSPGSKSATAHGEYPPVSLSSTEVLYFGKRTVQVPSAPLFAILCYFTRLDTRSLMFPDHISSRANVDSAAKKFVGPCREDVEHFITECRTDFEPWNPSGDIADSRGRKQPYVPGSLTGRWKGSSIVPFINEYRHWLNDVDAPETMETFCRQPLYITLQEHFCYSEGTVVPTEAENGMKDAWLPSSLDWEERDGGLEMTDESNTFRTFYQTCGSSVSRPHEVVDIVLTGQTDDPYATAWGAFNIRGRVRLSDGLIILRRESVAGLGTTLLRGYLTSSQNFAGRYRPVATGFEAAEWEAAFSLCKMEDDTR